MKLSIKSISSTLLISALFSSSTFADTHPAPSEVGVVATADEKQYISVTEGEGQIIAQRLQDSNGSMLVAKIRKTQSASFYEVELLNGDVVYSSPDGEYFVYGALYKVEVGKLTNITELRESVNRKSLMDQVDVKETVVFAAKGKEKAVISVFTDIDCGYCRKLHNEVPRLNELGITVRYLAFPRAGVYDQQRQYTGSFKKIKSVWCDNDPVSAMTKAKTTGFIKDNLDCEAPIEKQLMLGQKIGVRGTPAIVLQDGTLMPGYMPADSLAQKLGL
jgi:thiol:disulfide interchange protein DsbC